MKLGVLILAHDHFARVAGNVRIWAEAGCPVVVHVDSATDDRAVDALRADLADLAQVSFSPRHRSEWGTWGMVAATLAAAEQLLERHPDLDHVYLASGLCLPLRDIGELRGYLAASPETDFIESVATEDVVWPMGGLNHERFTLHFPFSFRRRRKLFDRYVRLQRRLRLHRRIPASLEPHLGSQWWCLSARTLKAILDDPARDGFDRYFSGVWIPDESYFQTLVRRHSDQIESRSLTLSKFDQNGKPHLFYDDHLPLLSSSEAFVARKIWPGADRLFETFPKPARRDGSLKEPNTAAVDRLFAEATVRRLRGRSGLRSQSRFPTADHERRPTARPYSVLHGFDQIYQDFEPWLARQAGETAEVHGHLFAAAGAEFSTREPVWRGGLSTARRLRDYDPVGFLRNLIWAGRDRHQCFLFRPDDRQEIVRTIAADPNARITVATGGWAVALYRSGRPAADVRKTAARLQRIEQHMLAHLRSPRTQAEVRIQTLAEVLEAPRRSLDPALADILGNHHPGADDLPCLPDLTHFADFLRDLKNGGMHPVLVGDIEAVAARSRPRLANPAEGRAI